MKRALAVVIVGALCAAAAGCDVTPPAASVDGVTISQSELQSQLQQVAGNKVVQCALSVQEAANGRTLPSVTGAGDDTVTTAFSAFWLDRLVQQVLEEHALAQRHAAVTAEDLAAARADYEEQLAAASQQDGSPCNLTGSTLVAGLPRSFVDQQARLIADQERLEAVAGKVDVSDAALRAYYQAHLSDVTERCVNLIVADDQASAQAIHDQIAAGTSFAAAADGAGVSTSTPTNGQGPCVVPADLAQQLGTPNAQAVEALADGQVAPPESVPVVNPVTGQTTPTWIVIGVRQHEVVPFADAESGLRQQLLAAAGSSLSGALERAAHRAEVQIDPRYGTWALRTGVVAPTPPPARLLLDPGAADSGTSGSLTSPG